MRVLNLPKNWRHPVIFVAFGFGSGFFRKAPGTFGSLMALPLFVLLTQLSQPVYWAVVAVATLFGFWICGKAAELMNVHDHEGIVWDEFVGQWLTLTAMLPVVTWDLTAVIWMFIGFGLFRLFDVVKPWPISWVDNNVDGGFGIMLDDLLAGVLAGLTFFVLYHYGQGLF